MSQDPTYLRPGQRVVVFPKILDKHATVLNTGNVGHDPVDSRWQIYEMVLNKIRTWPGCNCPVARCEEDLEIGRMPFLAMNVRKWTEDAKRIAVGHYRQVLEDGPEFCSSESDSEWNDQDDSSKRINIYAGGPRSVPPAPSEQPKDAERAGTAGRI
jgi:hypothetical protein